MNVNIEQKITLGATIRILFEIHKRTTTSLRIVTSARLNT